MFTILRKTQEERCRDNLEIYKRGGKCTQRNEQS